ncbi:MAG: aminoacyl-tRNA hydrolase [Deltaproteobacteria bacterium]|nr:aminoacyl-tRNA hydrolase [Deltaproteobacteria bacterium]
MWLVVGLGNPGREYEGTRHNVGFAVVDALARRHRVSFGAKFKGDLGQGSLAGQPTVLLKPQTYMNLSGQSVQPTLAFFKIPLDALVVVHDDLDLELGQIKLKRGGSSGGHNGLKSIDGALGSDYLRIRAGIGHPRSKAPPGAAREGNVVGHVLGAFKGKDAEDAASLVERCADAVEMLLKDGLEKTQMRFHALKPAPR